MRNDLYCRMHSLALAENYTGESHAGRRLAQFDQGREVPVHRKGCVRVNIRTLYLI